MTNSQHHFEFMVTCVITIQLELICTWPNKTSKKKIADLQWLNPDESKQTNIAWKIIYTTHLFLWDSIDVIARIILDWFKLRSIYRFIFNLKKKKNQRNIQIHPVLWRSLQVQNVHSFISLYVLWTKQLTLIYVRERKKIR